MELPVIMAVEDFLPWYWQAGTPAGEGAVPWELQVWVLPIPGIRYRLTFELPPVVVVHGDLQAGQPVGEGRPGHQHQHQRGYAAPSCPPIGRAAPPSAASPSCPPSTLSILMTRPRETARLESSSSCPPAPTPTSPLMTNWTEAAIADTARRSPGLSEAAPRAPGAPTCSRRCHTE